LLLQVFGQGQEIRSGPSLVLSRCHGMQHRVRAFPAGRRGKQARAGNFGARYTQEEHCRSEVFGRVDRAIYIEDVLRTRYAEVVERAKPEVLKTGAPARPSGKRQTRAGGPSMKIDR